jgi:hypothetical protein
MYTVVEQHRKAGEVATKLSKSTAAGKSTPDDELSKNSLQISKLKIVILNSINNWKNQTC